MKHPYEDMETEICIFDKTGDVIIASEAISASTDSSGAESKELEGEIMPWP